MKLRLLF